MTSVASKPSSKSFKRLFSTRSNTDRKSSRSLVWRHQGLFYGPPGCCKTLLAKAIGLSAKLTSSASASQTLRLSGLVNPKSFVYPTRRVDSSPCN